MHPALQQPLQVNISAEQDIKKYVYIQSRLQNYVQNSDRGLFIIQLLHWAVCIVLVTSYIARRFGNCIFFRHTVDLKGEGSSVARFSV
jgi:hypothetical protein